MIILTLLISIQISFIAHIIFLIQYVIKKEVKYLRLFINTAISNILLAGGITIVALFFPEQVSEINSKLAFWLFAGVIMVIMIFVKIMIFRNIYKRSKDPANFHHNFFGKKILHSSVVKPAEMMIFMMTIPFFLFAGAYFISRLINIILNRHL